MERITELFGRNVFNDNTMKERLPKDIYQTLKDTVRAGKPLDISLANVVANAMKDWAVERGVTHFTHWFQPMTGVTAEKHDSFLMPLDDSNIIMEFSGKELISSEPDASSFPSGGLRATFEARGYTAWDPTSYAFIKEGVLCIPSAFCSYGGQALDKKTPLLRSIEALNVQALRILRLFGRMDCKRVIPNTGAEQEYFLLDRDLWRRRRDLRFTGRTLFGASPACSQEIRRHYSGAIKPKVKAFMEELDHELWKLGILAKTEHNEAAPNQHELAPFFTSTNIASDHNQITMELMKKAAARHGMYCLLHEKPFRGVNGSGKHCNFSLSTDTGFNLLDPGKTPHESAQFLTFLCAVIKAVDEHQDLLRLSVASAGNDHRLGAHEAPPAVISMYLGEELTGILEAIESGRAYCSQQKEELEIGVDILPHFPKDATDRNRTSPFAFTGNKFEFRSPGASLSVAGPCIILNTIVADALMQFSDELEQAPDFRQSLNRLIRRTIKAHKRIIFNGNSYDAAWMHEAKLRGLLNLPSTPDALPRFTDEKNCRLFTRHNVFTEEELYSRRDILLENYTRSMEVELRTMIDMAYQEILPAGYAYLTQVANSAAAAANLRPSIPCSSQTALTQKLSALCDEIFARTGVLEQMLDKCVSCKHDPQDLANYYRDAVIPAMEALRAPADKLESLTASSLWPYPTYETLLGGL